MLRIEQLTKSYGTKKILDHVSFDVHKGHIAVLLGESGVGKSTLLRILNNLETFDSGHIYLDGQRLDVTTVNKTHVVGMVFQHFNLFDHLTVQQNITLALVNAMGKSSAEAHAIATKLLQHYNLQDKANNYPSELSGGQKQRLALARTIATRPQVICLDEPTSALDPMLTTYVAQHIQDLAQQGFTVLVATHDTLLLEKLSCTIYLMRDGKIIEYASSASFYNDRSAYPHIDKFVRGS